MKTPIFAIIAALATVTVAESQTPALPEASGAEADVIDLNASESAGKVALTASTVGRGQYVNIVCEDASIGEILRQFRKTVNANIISCDSTNLNRRVSISLHNAPWLDSLGSILNLGGFRLEDRNGVYFVEEENADDPVRTRSFTLNHASSVELAKLLNDSYAEKDKTGRVIRPIASAFKDANVVVITANNNIIRDCEAVIRAVDKASPQVYIEARFIELTANAMHQLGLKWDALKEYGVSAKNMHIGWERNYSELADGDAPAPSDGKWGTGANGGLTDGAASLGYRAVETFSGQIAPGDFAMAMSAFEQMEDVTVFSNPKIIVSNGKEAKVDMTTKFPNIRVTANRSSTSGTTALDLSTQVEVIPGEDKQMFAKEAFYSWGISLSVTPRIAPDGLINVEIIPTISEPDVSVSDKVAKDGFYQVQGTESSAGVSAWYPIISVKRLTTDFIMNDGSTAVIGGLSRTTESDVDSGIPYLRKIPWIGPRLFGWKSRQKVQREVIVFVTVGIANPKALDEDIGLPKNAVFGREYVEGRAQEPGDRGGVKKLMELDMSAVEDRHALPETEESVETEPAEPPSKPEPAEFEEPAGPTKVE